MGKRFPAFASLTQNLECVRARACVLQRSRVHYCSPLVVCCGSRFAASSTSVWSTIKPSQINREEVGRRVEVNGQCSLESPVQFEIRCAVPSLSVLPRMGFQQRKKKRMYNQLKTFISILSRTRKEKKNNGWQRDHGDATVDRSRPIVVDS